VTRILEDAFNNPLTAEELAALNKQGEVPTKEPTRSPEPVRPIIHDFSAQPLMHETMNVAGFRRSSPSEDRSILFGARLFPQHMLGSVKLTEDQIKKIKRSLQSLQGLGLR
jgi:hypothetical protein